MSQWLIFALITTLLYAGFDVLMKVAGTRINPVVGALYAQTASVVAILLFMLGKVLLTKEKFAFKAQGTPYAIIAGILVGIGVVTFLSMFATNARLSIASPLILVGRILITVGVGVLLFRENLTTVQSVGIITSILGLSLLIFS